MRSAANFLCSQLLFARPDVLSCGIHLLKLYSVILDATFSKEITMIQSYQLLMCNKTIYLIYFRSRFCFV